VCVCVCVCLRKKERESKRKERERWEREVKRERKIKCPDNKNIFPSKSNAFSHLESKLKSKMLKNIFGSLFFMALAISGI
jgi:hypothetical protein